MVGTPVLALPASTGLARPTAPSPTAPPSPWDRGCDGCPARRRRRIRRRDACSCATPDAARAALTSPVACGFRSSRRGRRRARRSDVCAASPVLLMTLVGGVLGNISLAALLAQVPLTLRIMLGGVLRRARRAARTFVGLVFPRDRRRSCGHDLPPDLFPRECEAAPSCSLAERGPQPVPGTARAAKSRDAVSN